MFFFWKNKNRIEELQKKQTRYVTAEDLLFLKRAGFINGCGGRNSKISKILAKFFSGFFFEASCEKHDFWYFKGWDEARRKECDIKFLKAMKRDVQRQFFLFRPYFYLIAYCFYFAVRIFGKKHFNYIKK